MSTLNDASICCVMMPLRPEYDGVLNNAIDPAVNRAGLIRKGPRMVPMATGGVFDRIRQDIAASTVCIADLTIPSSPPAPSHTVKPDVKAAGSR